MNSSANTLHIRQRPFDLRHQVVVTKQRGNRDEQAHYRCRERCGNTGGDRGDIDIAARGDGREYDHDADNGAEQTDKRTAGDPIVSRTIWN